MQQPSDESVEDTMNSDSDSEAQGIPGVDMTDTAETEGMEETAKEGVAADTTDTAEMEGVEETTKGSDTADVASTTDLADVDPAELSTPLHKEEQAAIVSTIA